MTSIKDVIKKSFLQNFTSGDMTLKTMMICLVVAALMGIFIFIVYRILTTNTFYSKTFNLSLMLMCVITAAIILTIQSSVIVSLGMVGALSIVRFRTAIKDPLDLIFLFWSISVGIISGAGMIGLAVLLSVIVTGLMFVFYRMPEQRRSMILSVSADSHKLSLDILQTVRKYDRHCSEKSRNMTQEGLDMLLEIRMKDCEPMLQELNALEGIRSVSLIAHRGEAVY